MTQRTSQESDRTNQAVRQDTSLVRIKREDGLFLNKKIGKLQNVIFEKNPPKRYTGEIGMQVRYWELAKSAVSFLSVKIKLSGNKP